MRKIVYCILIAILAVFTIYVISACKDTSNQASYSESISSTYSGTETKTYIVEFGAQTGGKIYGNLYQTVEEGGSSQKVEVIADNGYYFVGWADIGDETNDETITQSERIIENVKKDYYCYAMFERRTFQVEFIVGENGEVEGELVQSGKFEDETLNVTAVPNVGYRFVGWSDGVTEPTRKEQFTENKQITANFEVIKKEYTYNYKFADSGCDGKSISLTYGQLENTVFPVPKREHSTFAGWYADKYLSQQVSDEKGNIVIGNELVLSESTTLYAKWISENTHKFKLLIVYVTELNAELTTTDGKRTVQVNYKMTDLERKICKMITEKISFELNDLAVADFQVDEYFTTIPLTRESVDEEHPINAKIDHKIYAYDIPEVQGMLEEYNRVLVSFSMNDYSGDLRNSTGSANSKYGSINFDGEFTQLIYYNEPIENLLDPLYYYWDAMLRTYLHEFSHTIETCVNNMFEFHEVVGEYLWDSVSDPLIAEKLYLLNKAVVDGKKVGVPYEYWEGKVAEVYYQTTEGGKVQKVNGFHIFVIGHDGDTQYVLHGEDALPVIARPKEGYEFVRWSDGVETATRQDTNITADLHVYAIFKPIGT